MRSAPALARLARLLDDRRGVSAVEFALILPLLVLFSVGTIEVSRLILLTHKLQSAAFTLADLATRIEGDADTRTESLRDIFLAINQVVKPFDFAGSGQSIITSVASPTADDTPEVAWQCVGSGGIVAVSQVGESDHDATLPDGFDIDKGETIIAAEVFFDFQPLFGIGLLHERVIRRVAFFRPRLAELATLTCPTED